MASEGVLQMMPLEGHAASTLHVKDAAVTKFNVFLKDGSEGCAVLVPYHP